MNLKTKDETDLKKDLFKKITNNAYSFSVLTKVLSVLIGFVYTVVYTRYLGKELRGTASVINNYVELATLFLCLGMHQAYPYFKKKTGVGPYHEYINNILAAVLVYGAAAVGSLFFLRNNTSACVVAVLIPASIAVRELNYVVMIENPKVRNATQIGLEVFDILFLVVLFLLTKANYFYCILFLLVRGAASFVLAIQNLRVPLKTLRPTLHGIGKYIAYGFVPMLTLILMEINYKVDILMLEWMGITKADIGIYSLGVMLGQKLWLISDALRDILTSKLAGGRTKEEVCRITRLSLWVTFAFVLGMAIFGKPLIGFVYGAEFNDAYMVFLNISLGVLGMVFYKMIYAFNVVNGHKSVNFALLFVAAVINVVLNYFFILRWSINGAAIASTVSYTVCGVSFLIYFVCKTKTSPRDLLLVKKQDVTDLIHFIRK